MSVETALERKIQTLPGMAFQRMDRDNSGYISVENLKEVFGDKYQGISIENVVQEASQVKIVTDSESEEGMQGRKNRKNKNKNQIDYEHFLQIMMAKKTKNGSGRNMLKVKKVVNSNEGERYGI